MEADALFEKIDTASERLKFQYYEPMVFLYLLCVVLCYFAGFLILVFGEPLPSLGLFALGFLILLFIVYDGNRHRTVVSSIGIGGRPLYAPHTAIEWKHVEHIDVIPHGKTPSEFIFRGNNRYLWHDNHILSRKLTMDVIHSYIPDFDDWSVRQKLGWRKGVLVYTRPGSDDGLGQISETGRRVVDPYDDDMGHFATKEIVGSLSSDELLSQIKNDSECTKYTRWGNADSYFILFFTISFIVFIFIHVFYLAEGPQVVFLPLIIMVCLWIIVIWRIRQEIRKHGFYLSPLGIGAVEAFCDPRAIRWDHVEWVDVWLKDNRLHIVSFAGNQREIRIRNSIFHKRFEVEDIERYLPDYRTWTTSRDEDWFEGITRYRRTLEI
jgi:hypothetical protein